MIKKHEAISLGIGLAIHAGFLAAAERAPAPVYHYDQPEPPAYVELETLDKEEPPSLRDDVRPSQELATNTGPRERRSNEPLRSPSATRPPTSAAGSENPDTQSSDNLVPESPKRAGETPHDEFDEPMADNRPRIPGVDVPTWMMPDVIDPNTHGAPADTQAPKAKKVSRDKANEIIASALKEKDKALGLQLAAAGAVATTVKDAVWSSAIPDTAQGQFVVVLGADGQVKSVKATQGAGGSSADWDAAAANIKASLATRKFMLTDEYKNGAIIAVNVSSKRQLPSGSDPGSPIHLGAPGGQAGLGFDVMDIGAKPIRQVRTQTSVTAIK